MSNPIKAYLERIRLHTGSYILHYNSASHDLCAWFWWVEVWLVIFLVDVQKSILTILWPGPSRTKESGWCHQAFKSIAKLTPLEVQAVYVLRLHLVESIRRLLSISPPVATSWLRIITFRNCANIMTMCDQVTVSQSQIMIFYCTQLLQ
jgi:hypothetical protein